MTDGDISDHKKSSKISIQETFSGPLPPPAILQDFGTINPSFPERIFVMAEKEQTAVHSLQTSIYVLNKLQVETTAQAIKRGQIFGTVISLSFLAGAVYLSINGHDYVAVTLVGVTLLGIITLMITGRRHSK